MPLEAKPLFRPDVLRKHLDHFALPAAVKNLRPELAKWAGLIESKRIDDLTEKEILPDFLTVFFGKVLGFSGPAESASRYTTSTRSLGQPKSAARCTREYCRSADSRCSTTCCGVDCRI
jgi:hypothetical protein